MRSARSVRPPPKARCTIAWGSEETDAFKSQSRTLARHWQNWGVESELHEVPNANHFTILEGLRADHDGLFSQTIRRSLLTR